MTMNTVSTPFVKDISFAQCVHILLVVHNVSLLMSLESRFKEQEYQGDGLNLSILIFLKEALISLV